MSEIYDVGKLGDASGQDLYWPYLAARETDRIHNREAMGTPITGSVGVDIANGRIPNPKGAGIFALKGMLLAFDHLGLEREGNRIKLLPISKHVVSREGDILSEGATVLAKDTGQIRLAAMAVDTHKNPWALQDRELKLVPRLGSLGIKLFSSLEIPDYEVSDIDLETGTMTALPRKFIR